MAAFSTDADILRKRSVYHIANGNPMEAHKRIAGTTVRALAAGPGGVRCSDSIAWLEMPHLRSGFDDRSAKLVTEDNRRPGRPLASYDVDVGAADTRRGHSQLDLVR
jgi:hypothetical protein